MPALDNRLFLRNLISLHTTIILSHFKITAKNLPSLLFNWSSLFLVFGKFFPVNNCNFSCLLSHPYTSFLSIITYNHTTISHTSLSPASFLSLKYFLHFITSLEMYLATILYHMDKVSIQNKSNKTTPWFLNTQSKQWFTHWSEPPINSLNHLRKK